MTTPPLNPTRCLAGVDEAGLGPIMGPLVVAGVAMRGPEGVDPWRALDQLVVQKRPSDGQFHVADSKKVKSGRHGLARLERTALGFFAAWSGELPRSVAGLLEAAEIDLGPLRRCPWYQDLDRTLPLYGEHEALQLRSHLLARSLREHDIEIARIALRPVEVAEFNASIATTDNKSETHFAAYAEVLARLLAELPDDSHLVADRCGGRVHYRYKLQQSLPDAQVRTLRETAGGSSYRLRYSERDLRLTFVSQAEDRAFPTALASCFAKYLRELLMKVLNEWFANHLPELRPTAGYWTDGKRFLGEVAEFCEREALPRDLLVRCR